MCVLYRMQAAVPEGLTRTLMGWGADRGHAHKELWGEAKWKAFAASCR